MSNGGISFIGALELMFIILKLTGLIQWSWVWVLSPVWIGVIIDIIVIIVVCIKDPWLLRTYRSIKKKR